MSTQQLDPNTLVFPFADYFQVKDNGDIVKTGYSNAVIYTKIHSFCTNIVLGVSYTVDVPNRLGQPDDYDLLRHGNVGIFIGRSNRTLKLLVNNRLFEVYVQDVEGPTESE